MLTILGIPYEEHSSFLKGCALGPDEIRKAFRSPSSNTSAENERDLGDDPSLRDAGNLKLGVGQEARDQIESAVASLLDNKSSVLSLGGDHAMTYPILRAYGKHYDNLTVVQLDAHPDLYDELDGDRYSHACPFARALGEHCIGRLLQIGIRTMNKHQRVQAERFGVQVVTMKDMRGDMFGGDRWAWIDGPIYLSLDLDVLDPACAPGVSHHEPGGLTTREVIDLVQNLPGHLVGADLVELNPTRDIHNMTAMVAAKLFKELATKLLESTPQTR